MSFSSSETFTWWKYSTNILSGEARRIPYTKIVQVSPTICILRIIRAAWRGRGPLLNMRRRRPTLSKRWWRRVAQTIRPGVLHAPCSWWRHVVGLFSSTCNRKLCWRSAWRSSQPFSRGSTQTASDLCLSAGLGPMNAHAGRILDEDRGLPPDERSVLTTALLDSLWCEDDEALRRQVLRRRPLHSLLRDFGQYGHGVRCRASAR